MQHAAACLLAATSINDHHPHAGFPSLASLNGSPQCSLRKRMPELRGGGCLVSSTAAMPQRSALSTLIFWMLEACPWTAWACTRIGPNWGGGLHLQEGLPEGVFPLQGDPTPQPSWEYLLPCSGGRIRLRFRSTNEGFLPGCPTLHQSLT